MQLQKQGIRVLGISESFAHRDWSVLCGVVMRRDLHIDGFCFGKVRVGGMDATAEIIRMITSLDRQDVNAILLNGGVIAWYNVINPVEIMEKTGFPVICVSYKDSNGLSGHIRHHFPGDEERIKAYKDLGERMVVPLKTGLFLYARGYGCSDYEVMKLCKIFTLHGKIPEPVRVARLCARTIMHNTNAGKIIDNPSSG
ncbi:DUF99 family protein [Methanospirillum sp. J.3.6.1-F.2.7.3]|uniref:UPF0215 protein KHC33_06050 n=1 Tax=Methanospirillum purgamenti TaxID=2834276 RepID=A0A8E7B0C0_9EURY|nr:MULTISPECIES: DUF99 family protein [Methanospirillum]MDX8549921.1 DUF99 family protein [Methanospirillum hungatei]QVV90055.1 DUF99 family protein [Methanospirillum sp. J.3.6.1-F.2.7.3]